MGLFCNEDKAASEKNGTGRRALDAAYREEPQFKKAFYDMCTRLGLNPVHLLRAIAVESAGTFSAKACNEGAEASGLTQLMPSTLQDNAYKDLHSDVTRAEDKGKVAAQRLRDLSRVGQLKYIEIFFRSLLTSEQKKEKVRTYGAAGVYALNFLPAAFFNEDAALADLYNKSRSISFRQVVVLAAKREIYTRNKITPRHSVAPTAYEQNPWLGSRLGSDYITTGTLQKALDVINYIPDTEFSDLGYVYEDNASTLGLANRSRPQDRTLTGDTITPYIYSFNSFHPRIQYELERRKFTTELVDTFMPFVRLTSWMFVEKKDSAFGRLGEFLPSVNNSRYGWCPSLGIALNTSVQDMYEPFGDTRIQNIISNAERAPDELAVRIGTSNITNAQQLEQAGGKSNLLNLIGSSYVGEMTRNETGPNNTSKPIRSNELIAQTPSPNTTDVSNSPPFIPPPGIVDMNIERSTAGPMGVRGGLMRATIRIKAYSVGQVDTIMKYFLRPSTKVVLEFGHMSTKIQPKTFDWAKSFTDLQSEFWQRLLITLPLTDPKYATFNRKELVKWVVKNKELKKEYVYGNDGNYEILFGYVVKFNIKLTKDNIYDIELTVHSLNQFEVPSEQSGVKALCKESNESCLATSVSEYFSPNYSWKPNTFGKLLGYYTNPEELADTTYQYDIVPIQGSRDSTSDAEAEYYVTWYFFVKVILLDTFRGLLGIFPSESQGSMLSNLLDVVSVSGVPKPDNTKLVANEVGYHPSLRSKDPNTMIIANPSAQDAQADKDFEVLLQIFKYDAKNRKEDTNENVDLEKETDVFNYIDTGPKFTPPPGQEATESGVSNLLSGVWINTKAIKKAFGSATTITQGLQSLLNDMNNATEGYWNLQLLSSENPEYPGLHVVDMGLAKRIEFQRRANTTAVRDPAITSITNPINNKDDILKAISTEDDEPKYIYVFNERMRNVDDRLDNIGSELIDLNIDYSLPTAVAVQAIAGVGGSAQKANWELLDSNELAQLDMGPYTLGQNSSCQTDICAETNRSPTRCGVNPSVQFDSELKDINDRYAKRIQEINSSSNLSNNAKESRIQQLLQLKEAELSRLITKYSESAELSPALQSIRSVLNNYGYVGVALKFVELNPSDMIKRLNADSRTDVASTKCPDKNGSTKKPTRPVAHAMNSSNLTKQLIELTMPGIGGIELFQSFMVDRIPNIFKQGFYQVTKVVHEISPEKGWITKIQGRFRYEPDLALNEKLNTVRENGIERAPAPTGPTAPNVGAPAGTAAPTGRASAAIAVGDTIRSTTDTLNLRSTPEVKDSPGRGNKVLPPNIYITKEDQLVVTEITGDWVKVTVKNNRAAVKDKTGYVNIKYVRKAS